MGNGDVVSSTIDGVEICVWNECEDLGGVFVWDGFVSCTVNEENLHR